MSFPMIYPAWQLSQHLKRRKTTGLGTGCCHPAPARAGLSPAFKIRSHSNLCRFVKSREQMPEVVQVRNFLSLHCQKTFQEKLQCERRASNPCHFYIVRKSFAFRQYQPFRSVPVLIGDNKDLARIALCRLGHDMNAVLAE
jgi:hypothetical protein